MTDRTLPPARPDARDSERARWVALYVLCVGMLMIVLDATVVNVALPSIQADLGFSTAGLAWVVNAYLIAFGGLLLLSGRLGDLLGRRDVFLAGLAVFTLASLLCGVAQNQAMLVGARFLQGVGGAMTSAVILGMIVTMFPRPREQAQAIGVFAFVASAGGAVGLLVGGLLTQTMNWHWIFFVNVPIGLVTAGLARRLIEPGRGIGLRAGADVPGAVLISGSLMLSVFTIVKPAAEDGWSAPVTLFLLAASVALLAAFVAREATARTPLIALGIFRSRKILGANAVQVLITACMLGMFFLGALYVQRVLHYDALETGLAFLPVAVTMGVLSLRSSERLITRFGARTTMICGLALIVAGLILFAMAPVDAGYAAHVLPPMLLFGVGAGLCFPAIMGLAMADATEDDAGLASGLTNTTAQVGGALGLAVLATLASAHSDALIAAGRPQPNALTSGYHLAFGIGAVLTVAAIAVALLVVPPDVRQAGPAAALAREDSPAPALAAD